MLTARQAFARFRDRLGMYITTPDYSHATAFIAGYDAALGGGALVGFREWLVLRTREGDNLGWAPLVLGLAFPTSRDWDAELRSPEGNAHALGVLFRLLDEYMAEREKPRGLSTIFSRYEAWVAAGRRKRTRQRRAPRP